MADRGVLLESNKSKGAIAAVGVGPVGLVEMRFARDDDVVEAFSPDRADESFDVSVLPGRSRQCRSVPNSHGSKTLPYNMARGLPNTASR
jgi:hypothetical protein